MPIIQPMGQLANIPDNTRDFKVSYVGGEDDNFPKNSMVEVALTAGGQIQNQLTFTYELEVLRVPNEGTFNSPVITIENISNFPIDITFQ
ncbi:hypothetical protein QUA41_27355 [Microcoleus sp. Pol11C1]|uniref:hypothetical protein n=1 Tax=unclassified Microcoleus TaxID=2642155 RepID=UPI002FD74B84